MSSIPSADPVSPEGDLPTFDGPAPVKIDRFAPENLDAYRVIKAYDDAQPTDSFLKRTKDAAVGLVRDVWEAAKLGTENAIDMHTLDPRRYREASRRQMALFTQTVANLFGSSATTGETVRYGINRGLYALQGASERDVLALRQAKDRAMRDIQEVTDDALLIADGVVEGLDLRTAYYGEAEQARLRSAAAGLSEVVDIPFSYGTAKGLRWGTRLAAGTALAAEKKAASLGAEKLADLLGNSRRFAQSIPANVARAAAEAAERKLPQFGALRQAAQTVAELQERRLVLETAEHTAERATALADNAARIAEQRTLLEKFAADVAAQREAALMKAAQKPLVQRAAGMAVERTGQAVRRVGEAAGGTRLAGLGDNLTAAGRLLREWETSTPYFQRLARETTGWTQRAARQANRVEFVSLLGRGAAEAAEGATKGAAAGGLFGLLQGDVAGGMGEGLVGGFFGGALRTIQLERDPVMVRARQLGDIAAARARRTGAQQALFDEAPRGLQLAAATFEATNPHFTVSLVKAGGDGGSYRFNADGTGEATIDLDSRVPLVPLLAHETAHHIASHPEVAAEIRSAFFGTPEAPGLYTEVRDGQLALKPEFEQYRDEYIKKLEAAGKDATAYRNDPERLAHEIVAEAAVGDLLATDARGEFASVAAQRRGLRPGQALAERLARSPLVRESGLMQRALMATGAVFRADGRHAGGTGLFTADLSPEMRERTQRLVQRYNDLLRTERGQPGDHPLAGRAMTAAEVAQDPALREAVAASFDVDVDSATGAVHYKDTAEARTRRETFNRDLTQALDASPDLTAERVRPTAERDGAIVYHGKTIPADTLATLRAKAERKTDLIDNLEAVSRALREAPGTEVAFTLHTPASPDAEGNARRTFTTHVETPLALEVNARDGAVVHTLDTDALERRLEEFGRRGLLEPWADDLNAARAEAFRYAEATVKRSQLGDLAPNRARVLRALFEEGTATTKAAAGVVRTRPLDQISQVRAVEAVSEGAPALAFRPEEVEEGANENEKRPTVSDPTGLADENVRRDFHAALTAASEGHPPGLVEVKSPEFYANPKTRLFLSDDRTGGAAVAADGHLVSVFRAAGLSTDLRPIMTAAAAHATKANAYALRKGALQNLLSEFGFRPVAKVKFDPAHVPEHWTPSLGQPDFVFMVKDPRGRTGALDIKGNYANAAGKIPTKESMASGVESQRVAERLTYARKISEAFDITIKGDTEPEVRTAMRAIDIVHDAGYVPQILVVQNNIEGAYGAYHQIDGRPVSIELAKELGGFAMIVFLHEVAHFLDHQVFGKSGEYASEKHASFEEFRVAVERSVAIRTIRKGAHRNKKYLLDITEIWCRAYAQYIVNKCRVSILQVQLEKSMLVEPMWQWDDDDFRPIELVIDKMFKTKGWRR